MTATHTISPNLKQAVPFFGVNSMEVSLAFYVAGLGFEMKRQWVPDAIDDNADGRVRWCWLQRGAAAIMLQEFPRGRRPTEVLGVGVNVCFECEDALALYREFNSRGIKAQKRPFVGNGLWVVRLLDPDGYHIEFESPSDAPEETELAE